MSVHKVGQIRKFLVSVFSRCCFLYCGSIYRDEILFVIVVVSADGLTYHSDVVKILDCKSLY